MHDYAAKHATLKWQSPMRSISSGAPWHAWWLWCFQKLP